MRNIYKHLDEYERGFLLVVAILALPFVLHYMRMPQAHISDSHSRAGAWSADTVGMPLSTLSIGESGWTSSVNLTTDGKSYWIGSLTELSYKHYETTPVYVYKDSTGLHARNFYGLTFDDAIEPSDDPTHWHQTKLQSYTHEW